MEPLSNDVEKLCIAFRALGDPTRLQILRFLIDCSLQVQVDDEGAVSPLVGTQVGDVCCHLLGEKTQSSVISYHLRELRQANLIRMKKIGRRVICSINEDTLDTLRDVLAIGPSDMGSDTLCEKVPVSVSL